MKIQKGKSILLQSTTSAEVSDSETDLSSDFGERSTTATETAYEPKKEPGVIKGKNIKISSSVEDDDVHPTVSEPIAKTTFAAECGASPFYCVGWLLAISGPMVGNSFPLRAGRNSVGRDKKNAISLATDDAISRDAQVYVIYDSENNEYAIAPGNGSAISRVNNKRLDISVDLCHGDIITLSKKTQLRFIPACDEQFQWGTAE